MATDGKATIVLSAIDRTKQAFDSAKKNLDRLKGAGDGLALKFGSIGVAIGAAFQAVSFKHIIDAADNISKLTQRTGIAAESLTALKYAGELSDVSIDELADGLKKLAVNMSAAAGGSKEQQAAFSAIGVSVKTTSGQLRSTDEVLGDLADKFAGFSDGPEKAALAVALFGRSGDRLIPFLNSGRKGLADMRDEAQKLGVVFGDKLAKESEAFNDNLTRIQAGLEGVKVGILGGLLPALNTLLLELIEGRKAYGSFSAALIDQGLRAPLFQSYGAGAKAARDELALLNDQLDRLKNNKPQAVVEGAGGAGFVGPRVGNRRSADAERQLNEDKARAEKRLAYFKALQAAEALALGQGVVDERRFQGPRKKGAPVIDTEAAANAAALLRKQLDGRLQALRDGLANEQDLFEHANAKLAEAFAHGELSIDAFYDAKQSAQAAFLVKQQEAFDAEIREWEAYRAKLAKPQEQADVDNLITKALTEQSKATREAGQAAEVAGKQRVRAGEEFQRSLQDIDAQLKELSGDTYGAALLRNARQLADAEKQLAKGGGDPKRIADLTQLLKLQADQVHLQEQLALLDERQAVAEEAYIATARARGTGLVEQEQGVQAIRQKGVDQLQLLADKVAALAQVSKDPRLHLWADQLALALTKAQAQVNPTLERVRAAADEMGEALGSATEQAIMDFENLDDVVMNLARDLERIVLRTLVTEPLTESLKGMLQKFAPAVASMASGTAPAGSGGAAGVAGAVTSTAAQQTAVTALGTLAAGATTAGTGASALGLALPPAASAMASLTSAAFLAASALQSVAGKQGSSAFLALFNASSSGGSSVNGSAGTASIAQYAHSGGIVGEGGNYRPVPAGLFDGAMGYRSGGIAGLAPDEVPAILHRGEEVLRQGDPRHRDNGGSAPSKQINLNVNVTAMQGMSNKTAAQQGAAAGRAARAALARND